MSSAPFQGLKVLLVEDEMMVSMLIEDMLADLGCLLVGPVARIDEALTLVATVEADCALLDVNLGGQGVFPVADALKARGRPFAYSTGYGEAGLRPEDQGVPVLQKPFRQSDLERVLGVIAPRPVSRPS